MGRDSLERTLSSIADQQYQNLLVVLIDASGQLFESIPLVTVPVDRALLSVLAGTGKFPDGNLALGYATVSREQGDSNTPPSRPHPSEWPDFTAYPFPILLVSRGFSLSRALAADLALTIGCRLGEFAIFLDDDDMFLGGHLDALQSALSIHKDAVLAHTAAYLCNDQKPDLNGSLAGNEQKVGRRFEPWELLHSNHIPIHCALFRTSSVLKENLSFDVDLDVFEDWDFWLQLQRLGKFHWVDGCTAKYFIAEAFESSSLVHKLSRDDKPYLKIWRKWRQNAPEQWWDRLLTCTGPLLTRLETLEQTVQHFYNIEQSLEHKLHGAQQSLQEHRSALEELRKELSLQFGENQRLHVELRSTQEQLLMSERELATQRLTMHRAIEQHKHREQHLLAEQANALALAEQWHQRCESLSVHSGHLQARVDAMLLSRSWRITQPLRRLGTLARSAGLGRLVRAFRQKGTHVSVAGVREAPSDASLAGVSKPSLSTQVEVMSGAKDSYQSWIRKYEQIHFTSLTHPRKSNREKTSPSSFAPLISIIMPMFNAPLEFFQEAIASVLEQDNPAWELCIADDASTQTEALNWLKLMMLAEPRIKLIERNENGHISACSNSALSMASADWIALLDQDDRLSPFAVSMVTSAFSRFPQAQLIYSDEDKIDQSGRRFDPYFKPAFNLELLRAQNTFSHLGVYKRSLVEAVGGFRLGLEGSQDHDLVMRCVERINADQVIHIPSVLYHWRVHGQSTAADIEAKPYALTNGLNAINEHLSRTLSGATASLHESVSHYIVQYPLPLHLPDIDVIIPTRNGYELLRRCLDTLFQFTDYPRMHVTVVDNGSDDTRVLEILEQYKKEKRIKVIHYDTPFNFSRINNLAVAKTQADYLLFLNNDIEVIRPDWLDVMLRQASRSEVGAVGAMLWYPDFTMQHAGVVVGAGGVAGHAHHRLPKGQPGYFGRAVLPQEVSAVTAACLMMRRNVFNEAGGFDEENFAVAFNDVDLCLKVRRLGYKIIFTPRAELIHHESATRGDDLAPEHRERFERECESMRRRWPEVIKNDPAYNPNLEIMSSTYQSFGEPRSCEARNGLLPVVTA